MCFFFALITKFFDRYKRLNDYTPDEDDREAGIERLNNLSSFGTPLTVARRTNMTPEQILMRPADEVYMILLYDFEQYVFEKNRAKIKEDNEAMQRALRK